jgi:hypothetical protein
MKSRIHPVSRGSELRRGCEWKYSRLQPNAGFNTLA